MGVYNGEQKANHCRAHTDRTGMFYCTCEKKQQIECKAFLCDSAIGHACQNIIGPTGVRARHNSRTINNL